MHELQRLMGHADVGSTAKHYLWRTAETAAAVREVFAKVGSACPRCPESVQVSGDRAGNGQGSGGETSIEVAGNPLSRATERHRQDFINPGSAVRVRPSPLAHTPPTRGFVVGGIY